MAGVRPDAAYRVGQLQQRQARERGETPPEAPHTTIEGYLSKPDGSGPFPAVCLCPWMQWALGRYPQAHGGSSHGLGLVVQPVLDEVSGYRHGAIQVHRGLPAIREPFELNELRRQCRNDAAVSRLARIPDRFSEHGVKLALAEFLRLPRCCLP
jgi:hypothetical protein